MRRFLEINHEGIAFHEPRPNSPFSTGLTDPPTEVLFCDCKGVGVVCHHVYANGQHAEIDGPEIVGLTQDAWKAKHAGPGHAIRRQIFVNVTDRPEAKRGMRYDEKTDTFSEIPQP